MGKIAESTKRLRSKRAQRGPNVPKNEAKPARKVINMAERARIEQRAMMGHSNRKIARETGHSKASVARIIAESDIPKYVEHVRGKFVGLGDIAVETLEKEMRKGGPGAVALAYKFLKDTGIIADIEGRAFASRVAGVDPAKQLELSPDALQFILGSLSAGDRRIFRVLSMVQTKSKEYGIPDFDDVPAMNVTATEVSAAAPAESAPDAKADRKLSGK